MKKKVFNLISTNYKCLFVISLALVLIAIPLNVRSQNLTVELCQEKARSNYPLVKQMGLIEKSSQYSISTASKAYLPQFTLSARATYQSEVTSLPIKLPGVVIPELANDQYQATLEMSQVLWDGGAVSSQKKGIKAQTESELQKLNVDLYALNDRVNQLYFGILLLKEQLLQNSILQDELLTNYKRIEAYKTYGVANQSDLDAIKVEQINAEQRKLEIKSTSKSFRQMLGGMIAQELDESTVLEKPIVPELNYATEIKRPELIMLDAQSNYIESQRDAVMAGTRPRVSLFLQGGYGRPGLNMLNNAFSPYYIGGVRFAWNLSGFYSQKSNIDKIEVNRKQVDVQKETFLFNNNLSNKQHENDIERLKKSIQNDENIIQLRNNIKKSCEVKVQNGTATVTDLLREINAENMAKQAKSLHQIQLYIAVYQFKNNTNN